MIDNMTLLQKADLVLNDLLTDGGLLQPSQAKRFIRIMIEESKLLGSVQMVPMKGPKHLLENSRFATRILRPGNEATALAIGDRAKPDLGKVELSSELFKAEVRLNNEVLEDSIERGELRNTIMTQMGEAIARDWEEVVIQGNTAGGFASNDPRNVLDGILKQAVTNLVAGGSVSLAKAVLRDMQKSMPNEFLRNKTKLRYFTSMDAEVDYGDSLGDRATIGGDAWLARDIPLAYKGIQVIPIPKFPEDLSTDETNVILTDPKNIAVGIQRKIKVETDKDISAGELIIVVTLRGDVKYEFEKAVVKATAVKVT